MSVTARNARPIRRLISWVRPPTRPRFASRCVRSWVARGSIAYSAVTQPVPRPLSHCGTRSSIVRTQDLRAAELDQRAAFGKGKVVRLDGHRTQFVAVAPVGSCSQHETHFGEDRRPP